MAIEPLFLLEMIGTAVFAISGALAASRANMDIFGFAVLALMPAVGGGTMRDIMLGRFPVFWIQDSSYVTVAVLAAVAVYFFADRPGFRLTMLIWMDAAGLSLFAVLGTKIALNAGVTVFIATMMGVTTAVLGGMIRDIICNEIPLVLSGEVYATAAFAASIAFILALRSGVPETIALAIGVAAGFTVRAIGIVFHLRFPRVNQRE